MALKRPGDLLLDLSAIDPAEMAHFAKQTYSELYLQNRGYGVHSTHDGHPVRMDGARFHHAFYNTPDHHASVQKTILDLRRVERMKWILPLMSGQMLGSECWEDTSNAPYTKRLYCIPAERNLICCGWSRGSRATVFGFRLLTQRILVTLISKDEARDVYLKFNSRVLPRLNYTSRPLSP
jgi:hypothetical protein